VVVAEPGVEIMPTEAKTAVSRGSGRPSSIKKETTAVDLSVMTKSVTEHV
jgi:hypothetical protein